jgi:succinate-semialdehyde dehydrogenase/glutarate-semialdehyde dehydrogenase
VFFNHHDIAQVESVIASDIVHGITLTGSEMVLPWLCFWLEAYQKNQLWSWGGSDAFIVLNDADIEKNESYSYTQSEC